MSATLENQEKATTPDEKRLLGSEYSWRFIKPQTIEWAWMVVPKYQSLLIAFPALYLAFVVILPEAASPTNEPTKIILSLSPVNRAIFVGGLTMFLGVMLAVAWEAVQQSDKLFRAENEKQQIDSLATAERKEKYLQEESTGFKQLFENSTSVKQDQEGASLEEKKQCHDEACRELKKVARALHSAATKKEAIERARNVVSYQRDGGIWAVGRIRAPEEMALLDSTLDINRTSKWFLKGSSVKDKFLAEIYHCKTVFHQSFVEHRFLQQVLNAEMVAASIFAIFPQARLMVLSAMVLSLAAKWHFAHTENNLLPILHAQEIDPGKPSLTARMLSWHNARTKNKE